MALSENIPYIYDNKVTSNGIVWGSTLRYVLTKGDRVIQPPYSGLDIVNQCCFIRPGSYAPYASQCLAIETTTVATTLSAIFRDYPVGVAYFLCDGPWQSTELSNQYNTINGGQVYNVKTGVITPQPTPYQLLPAARIAVGNLDLSHYVIVPSITAKQHNSSVSITADYKTYKNQYSASHPDIVQVSYQLRYKADLMSTTQGSTIGYKLWGSTQNNSNLNYQHTSSSVRFNTFDTRFSSVRLRPISGALYTPPQILVEKFNLPGVGGQVWSLKTVYGLSSTHGISIQKLGWVNPDNHTNPYVYIDFSTATKIIESIGMWWAESLADIADVHGSLTVSGSVHMPLIDENGNVTGSISGGDVTDIEDSPIYQQWNEQNDKFPVGGDDALGKVAIDPDKPIPPDTSETQTPLTLEEEDPDVMPEAPKLNGLGVFSNYYALAKNGVDQLNDFLWNSDESVIDDILNSLKLFGQSPIDAIISLRLYPFNLVNLLPSSLTPEEIVLGRVETGVTGLKIPSDASTTINLGSIYIPRKYGNFLDFAPYSSYSLYIPFCGVVNLNPNIYLDHYVSVKMVVDITTGKCTAIIYVGSNDDYGVPIEYVDGMIGVEIPITAENMGRLASAVIEAVGNTAAAAVSTGIKGAAFAAVGGAIDVLFSDVAPQKTGSISASGSLSMPIKMYAVISNPRVVVPENYGHAKGYATDITSTVSGQSGYTVCYNVDTSSIAGATDTERSEIKSLLEGGIFI